MSELALRAGDADRDRVAAGLRDHLVAGRLTLDEFVERVDRAHEARTLAELEELTRDLPAVEPSAPVQSRRKASSWIVAVMSGSDRRRRWRLAAKTTVVAVMGGANLDLRQAELEAAESELTIYAVMGGVNVIVPEGIDVDVSGIAVMGGKDVRVSDAPVRPGAPFVRIRVYAVMGGVSVRSKRGRELPR